jgi:hypothetical protein
VRTPRGLLATLGATLSMVAAAACVLLFTSTLVAVKGWPGLSAPPNGGPVALAPVERQAVRGESDGGSRDTPVVLGAPAATSGSAAPVGLGPSPAAGDSQGEVAGQHIETGSGPIATTRTETQQNESTPGTVVPIGLAPTGTGPSIVPAVEVPVSTPVTTPQTNQDEGDTGYTPSERRVTVNAIPETVSEWPSDADEQTDELEPQSEALAPQTYTRTPQTYTRTPATSWPEEEPEAPAEDELAPTVTSAPEADRDGEQPTRQSARTWQPDAVAEDPQPATEPTPEPSSEQPRAEEPAAQPKPDAGTQVEPKPEPCPPAAEPQPEPKPEPQPCPPEQTAEPTVQTPEPQPEAAPQPDAQPASPAPEQAPATQPCP